MKNNSSLFLGMLILAMLTNCDNVSVKKPEAAGIAITVKDYYTKKPLAEVRVVLHNGGVSTPVDTTALDGKCTLTNVTSQDSFDFIKPGYEDLEIVFEDFNDLASANFYLKSSTPPLELRCLKGTVHNAGGATIENVLVFSGTDTTKTDKYGAYRLPISIPQHTEVTYYKNALGAKIKINVEQDTAIVDVFIDGITLDSINTKLPPVPKSGQ